MKYSFYKRIIGFAAVLIVLVAGQNAYALGQITTPIEVKNVLRGQIIEDELIIFNSEATAQTVDVIAEGDIAPWTTFYQTQDGEATKELTIPAATNITTYVRFTVPDDTPNGTYTGEVSIISRPPEQTETDDTNVTIKQRISREVSIVVTDQEIINVTAGVIPESYAPDKDTPLIIKVAYDNQGNVAITPEVEIKITRIEDAVSVLNAIYPYPESEKSIAPLAQKTVAIEWPTVGQKKGKYTAEVTVRVNDQVIETDEFKFEAGSGMILGTKDFANLSRYAPAIIVIVVAVALYVVSMVLKKKNADAQKKTAKISANKK